MDKSFIIAEIQRTATENGGKALGTARFEAETGIGESVWIEHWPTLRDAQTEAGVVPSELNQAYDDDYVIEQFAVLTRRIRKWPSKRYLKHERKNNQAFPSVNVYLNDRRTVHQLATQVADWCRQRDGFDEVIDICEAKVEQRSSVERSNATTTTKETAFGWVYLYRDRKRRSFYKIGKTMHAGRRNYELQRQFPEEPEVVHEIKTDDPNGVESYWKNRFRSKQVFSELYELNVADVRAFKRWKRIY